MMQQSPRVNILGVGVSAVNMAMALEVIEGWIAHRETHYICVTGVHGVMESQRDEELRRIHNRAGLVTPDGMPLILYARLLGYAVQREQRVTYMDWVHPLMQESAEKGWKVFYLGGKPGVVERAAAILQRQYAGLQIATHHGYFKPEENQKVLEEIASYRPHVLMVGMGMPRQKHWVLENLEHIQANAILTAGACFDYIAGAIPTPPRWMGRLGLEWLYRLWSEPTRLAKRYLLEPWFLVPWVLKDIARRIIGGR